MVRLDGLVVPGSFCLTLWMCLGLLCVSVRVRLMGLTMMCLFARVCLLFVLLCCVIRLVRRGRSLMMVRVWLPLCRSRRYRRIRFLSGLVIGMTLRLTLVSLGLVVFIMIVIFRLRLNGTMNLLVKFGNWG